MKKDLIEKIEIPEGIGAILKENELTIKGVEGEISRKFDLGKVNFSIKEKGIILDCEKSTKREKKLINTLASHIRNMIKGVQEKFEYKLKICSSHFPMTVKIKDSKIIVKNFLGEKVDREKEIPEGVEVKIEKEFISVISVNKEIAGQTAANFEMITKIRKKDRRIFQDGIYIINKAGREI